MLHPLAKRTRTNKFFVTKTFSFTFSTPTRRCFGHPFVVKTLTFRPNSGVEYANNHILTKTRNRPQPGFFL
ncbi:hypothetical protein HanHA89_Chr04g0137911 [Helianthus annuus]|nr:hypothetical protein HanHA89_Chr04g0137911 [Helianthus annuus]